MRTKLLAVVVLAGMSAFGADYDRTVWRAVTHGAEFDVLFKVVDDGGAPVANAKCSGWMYIETAPKQGNHYSLHTDTNGFARVAGRCGEWFSVVLCKEGYYDTMVDSKYPNHKVSPPIIDGKWQPYGETRTVVLKRIKNPYAVKVFTDEQCHRKIPSFDQWLPFDMEQSDWLAPYGKGVHNDVLLRFHKKLTDKWYDFAFSMEACFTNNPHAGVYVRPLDEYSDLKSSYFAETNATYCTNYNFSFESVSKKRAGLDKNSYLVFRTRTRVDENGKLVGAHYGKYSRGWRSDDKEMRFGAACFNPVENDSNIEGDQSLLNRIRNYKKGK